MTITKPTIGEKNWGGKLNTALDVLDVASSDTGVASTVTNGTLTRTALGAYVDTALASHTPGAEIAYAERITSGSTTATVIGVAANITGLLVNVVGTGRPVDIELYLSGVYHTVAGSLIQAYVANNGSVLTAGSTGTGWIGYTKSDVTNAGTALILKRRMVLTDGVAYSFQAGFYSAVAGSSVFSGAAYSPNYLSVTAR